MQASDAGSSVPVSALWMPVWRLRDGTGRLSISFWALWFAVFSFGSMLITSLYGGSV